MLQTTMVGPTGVENIIAERMPTRAQETETTVESITTSLKVLATRIDASAGKITSADISNEPTRFIASTMMTAVMTAISKL